MPSDSHAEESKAQKVELVAEAKSHAEEEEKHATSAQVEDTVQIKIQDELGKPPALDASSFNKESSERKEEDLAEDSLTGPPKDGDSHAVEAEEKKANEESISEVAQQD